MAPPFLGKGCYADLAELEVVVVEERMIFGPDCSTVRRKGEPFVDKVFDSRVLGQGLV